jgi:hypothetical protein
MRLRVPDWCLDEWQETVREHIRRQMQRPDDALVVSAEALSYLRYPDEVHRLRRLLEPRDVSVVVVLREPKDFLESFALEQARRGFSPSPYRESFAYVEDDSWLIRYDNLIDVYTTVFGSESLTILNYEDCIRDLGTTLPAILGACDPKTLSGLPPWDHVWENASRPRRGSVMSTQRIKKALPRWLRTAIGPRVKMFKALARRSRTIF